ncbi:Sortilin [Mizuhopecten yessoensis]|uniref:Sortilin n=1 Tax=Mizuhopecten yessoensis TaxID=6573 RepID=A0A210Q171_MIZYE|nr:Sortilin [Mizuhopecten yessoensis]
MVSHYYCYLQALQLPTLASDMVSHYQCYLQALQLPTLASDMVSHYHCYFQALQLPTLDSDMVSHYHCYYQAQLLPTLDSDMVSHYQCYLQALQLPTLASDMVSHYRCYLQALQLPTLDSDMAQQLRTLDSDMLPTLDSDMLPTLDSDMLPTLDSDMVSHYHCYLQALQVPTLDSDMFYSVMDMEEDLVFMHVDDPGDTGHGTLYTSGGKGVIYSRSLEKHLYPNYGDTTDFYRMDSMRGVYIASQMSADDSIHSMITYNQGGSWQPIPRPEGGSCKDEKKDCNLQIHGTYSITRGILAQSPISVSSAIGVAMVHGHIADALQTTHPDVYITRDGGYKWIKALDGPHHYHIADSGSLLVAVPSDTDKPKVIKFSTDEGRCWHSYTFIKNDTEAIKFTGLLTEPGSTSMTVSIWGYHPDNRKWTAYVFDFQSILKQQCTSNDYEEWLAHETVRKYESESMKGCLLGEKEMFKRLKPDSWCHNGYDYVVEKDVQPCTCSREDFECDYGYYRPVGGLDCLRNRSMTILDICMQGREEEIITEGFRKIPGDVCKNGFSPSGKVINLSKHCKEGDKSLIDIGTPVEKKGTNGTVVAAIVLMVILIVVLMSIYFGYKLWMIRKHRVVYRYSLLNQSEAGDYDNEFENALSPKSVVYQDSSDDEELNSPAVKKDVTKKKSHSGSSNSKTGNGHVFKSYHDDSDVWINGFRC